MAYELDRDRYLRLAEMLADQPSLAAHFRGLADGTIKPVSLQPEYRKPAPAPANPFRAERRARKRLHARCITWEAEFYDWVADMDDGVVYEITEEGIRELEEIRDVHRS